MTRALFQLFWLPLYRLWALRYIRRERWAEYSGVRVQVPPGVFHPGVFFSTPIFIKFLQDVDFQDKKVLDIGTGSGLLALFAAQKGGIVTALDIHALAVETTRRNAAVNGLALTVLQSDLFDALPPQPFDFILVNPPYYPRAPRNKAEHAFFAGEHLEYFEKFFRQVPSYITAETKIWMILSEDCDLEKIGQLAEAQGFKAQTLGEQKKWAERFFVVGYQLSGTLRDCVKSLK